MIRIDQVTKLVPDPTVDPLAGATVITPIRVYLDGGGLYVGLLVRPPGDETGYGLLSPAGERWVVYYDRDDAVVRALVVKAGDLGRLLQK